nr:hypothetical protein [Arthrobacter sp. SO5]
MAGVLLGDHEVEIPGPGLVQGGLGFPLRHFDPDFGIAGSHPGQGVGHERQGRGLEDGHPHRPGHGSQGGCEVGLGLLQRFQQLSRVRHEDFGLRRQLHAASGLAEQLHAGFLFQQGQLLRDRRRAVLEGLGHLCQGAPDFQFPEKAQPPDVEHCYSFAKLTVID